MGFPIRYLARPPNPWHLVGRGELSVSDTQVLLSGHKRLFLGGRQQLSVPREQLINVAAEGKLVRCELTASASPQTLKFLAHSAQDAQAIVALLPQTVTAQFRLQQSERQAYQDSLRTRRALVTPTLIALNVLVFIAMVATGMSPLAPGSGELLRWGSNFGPFTLDGQWWRLFTSMFLHFGLAHLAFNMLGLWSLGKLTERLFGSAAFLFIYLFAGLCGSLGSLLWHPLINSAGASGAIFGVLGALLAFMINPRTRIPAHIAAAQRNSALIFIAYNLFNGFAHAGIDNAAHIGGLLAGIGMGWFLALPLERQESPQTAAPRRLALALLIGIPLLAGVWGWLAYAPRLNGAERGFRRQFLAVMRGVTTLELDWQYLVQQAHDRKMGDAELAGSFAEQQTRWKDLAGQTSLITLPAGSKLEPLRQSLNSWLSDQSEAMGELAAGLRASDKSRVELAVMDVKKNQEKELQIAAMSRELN